MHTMLGLYASTTAHSSEYLGTRLLALKYNRVRLLALSLQVPPAAQEDCTLHIMYTIDHGSKKVVGRVFN